MSDNPYRAHVLRVLDWEDAHVGFDAAVSDIPSDMRGRQALRACRIRRGNSSST